MRQANLSANSYIGLLVIVLILGVVFTQDVLSSDARLRLLTIEPGDFTPTFDPATTSYTATVDNSIDAVDVRGVLNDPDAILTVNGLFSEDRELILVPLQVGENTISISVRAVDLSTETYTIVITREAP